MDIPREHGNASCTPTKKFTCSLCDHLCASKQSLNTHMRRHTGERPFKCEVDDCEKAFKQEASLSNHIKWKHSDERPLECDFPGCRFTTKTALALSAHKKVHSDDRPLACSECHFKTKHKKSLKEHRIRRHSVGADIKCGHPECEKSFKSSAILKSHFSNQHEEKNLKCDHPGCGGNFANAKALNRHERNVHSTKSLVCSNINCNYRTNHSTNLARHMIINDKGNEKISCSIEGCKYKGKNSRALEDHLRRHKTLLPCPESGCGHYAATKEVLKIHLKRHNSSGRPFKCPLCSKYYPTLYNLQDHCFAHTNEKPFACGHCEHAAPFRGNVQRHISSAHANIKFPFIVHLVDDRECLECKVVLPFEEFLRHCKGHVDPDVMEA